MNTDRRDTNLCVVVLTRHASGMHKVIAAAPDRAVTDASKLTVAFRVMVLAKLLWLATSLTTCVSCVSVVCLCSGQGLVISQFQAM